MVQPRKVSEFYNPPKETWRIGQPPTLIFLNHGWLRMLLQALGFQGNCKNVFQPRTYDLLVILVKFQMVQAGKVSEFYKPPKETWRIWQPPTLIFFNHGWLRMLLQAVGFEGNCKNVFQPRTYDLLVICQVSNGLAEEGLRILQSSKGDLENWAASHMMTQGQHGPTQTQTHQWIVAARPLCHLQYPVAYLSHLQRIPPAAPWELRFKASHNRQSQPQPQSLVAEDFASKALSLQKFTTNGSHGILSLRRLPMRALMRPFIISIPLLARKTSLGLQIRNFNTRSLKPHRND